MNRSRGSTKKNNIITFFKMAENAREGIENIVFKISEYFADHVM